MQLILEYNEFFIWYFHYFNAPFCFIVKYFQSKKLNHMKKQNNVQSSCMKSFFLFYVRLLFHMGIVLLAITDDFSLSQQISSVENP